MRSVWSLMMMMAMSTQHLWDSLYHKDNGSILSLSLMTNQHSMQMITTRVLIATRVCGLINPIKQPLRARVKVISSSGEQMALPLGSSYSTMHPVTKSVPLMHCQHETCPSSQTSTGLVSKMALRCGQVHFLPG